MKPFFVLLISLISFVCGPTSAPAQEALPEAQADAVAAIKKPGGRLTFDKTSGEVVSVALNGPEITDAGVEHLKALPRLTRLRLDNTQITDAGLVYLKKLISLKSLYLNDTQVTDAGLAEFKEALPKCTIYGP